mmetsp:Transcript_29537/g.96513  ORF Transcript_29537/g.96513 Transcript_29537/m.96513 type:complete len:200 (-) Transcript_29537:121-720(-)
MMPPMTAGQRGAQRPNSGSGTKYMSMATMPRKMPEKRKPVLCRLMPSSSCIENLDLSAPHDRNAVMYGCMRPYASAPSSMPTMVTSALIWPAPSCANTVPGQEPAMVMPAPNIMAPITADGMPSGHKYALLDASASLEALDMVVINVTSSVPTPAAVKKILSIVKLANFIWSRMSCTSKTPALCKAIPKARPDSNATTV